MPKIVDQEQRRQEIAEAVLRVVAREGVGGVTMRVVAVEAGWSTGVLNHYFENKQELLVGGLREAARVAGRNMSRAMKERTGRDCLRVVIEEGMPLDERREALCRIFFFFWAEGVSDPNLAAELATYYDWWRDLIRQAIQRCQAEGWLRNRDPEILAEMLVAVADGVAVQAMFNKRTVGKRRQRRHVEEWLEILEARPAGGRKRA
ncbi:MAG: TetR/AcrR family transcriptional regulator [Alphaproteobacteria bacterium]